MKRNWLYPLLWTLGLIAAGVIIGSSEKLRKPKPAGYTSFDEMKQVWVFRLDAAGNPVEFWVNPKEFSRDPVTLGWDHVRIVSESGQVRDYYNVPFVKALK